MVVKALTFSRRAERLARRPTNHQMNFFVRAQASKTSDLTG